MNFQDRFDLITIGCSAGGISALQRFLQALAPGFRPAIAIVQHIGAQTPNQSLAQFFSQVCLIPVKEAEDKEPILPGHVYFAPNGYHLLVNEDRTFQLSVEETVNFSRPSIDVLFETAAESYRARVAGFILTGSNSDGGVGLRMIADQGGGSYIQTPETAEFSAMPEFALQIVQNPSKIFHLDDVKGILCGEV